MKRPSLRKYLLGMAAGFGAIALGIAFFFLLYRFDGVRRAANTLTAILMPFIYGGAIAYLLKPFCNWCEGLLTAHLPAKARRAAPPLAVAASLVFGLLVVYALFLMIIPQLIRSVLALSTSFPARLDGAVDWLMRYFADNPALYRFLNDAYDAVSDEVAGWLRTSVMPSLQQIIIGVTNVIPFFGPFIGAVPATLLILIEDPVKALWFVLFILVLQQLDGNVIGPLSSFWVLFSILLFGGLWGFIGMIVGVPLFAVLYDLVRKFALWGLGRNGQAELLADYHRRFCGPPDP